MGAVTEVNIVYGSIDLKHPRFLCSHPRNAAVDWAAVDDYARHGRTDRAAEFPMYLKTRRPVDVIMIAGLAPIVSDRLRQVLGSVAGNDIEFVPVIVNSEPYWILRVVTVIDALDAELTEFGTHGNIERPVWLASRLTDPQMFRVPQQPTTIWATPGVAAAVRQSVCTDMNFFPRGEVVL